MRLLVPFCLGLATVLSCSPTPPTSPDPHTAAVALDLLEKTASTCDRLAGNITGEWMTLQTQSASAFPGSVPAKNILTRFPRMPLEIAALEAEAERRVSTLESRHALLADLAFKVYATTRDHCATIAYPTGDDLKAYRQTAQVARQSREDALEEARKLVPTPGRRVFDEVRFVEDQVRVELNARFSPNGDLTPAPPSQERAFATEPPPEEPGRQAPIAATDRAIVIQSWTFRYDRDRLRIEGDVRNGGSAPLDEAVAVVRLLDYSGNELKTYRIPFQTKHLAPSDTSRFALEVPDSRHQASRGQISFLDGDGQGIEALGEADLEKSR